MAFDAFTDQEVKQTAYNQQVGVSGGAKDSTTNVAGANAIAISKQTRNTVLGQGNVTGNRFKGVKGNIKFDITSSDPAVAIAAIQANQALATQATSFANQNASHAFEALQGLGNQLATVASGGQVEQELTEAATNTKAGLSKWQITAVVLVVLVGGTFVYMKLK